LPSPHKKKKNKLTNPNKKTDWNFAFIIFFFDGMSKKKGR